MASLGLEDLDEKEKFFGGLYSSRGAQQLFLQDTTDCGESKLKFDKGNKIAKLI